MKTTKSAIRITTLIVLFSVGFVSLFAEPLDDSPWWFEQFIISKTIAAGAFYAFYRLYDRWKKSDKWLRKYDKACDEATEAPNPLYIGKEAKR